TSLFPCAEEAYSEALLEDAGTGFKEGRLKPSFADNVGIPLAGARRLKPCPRKATVRSGKQLRTYVAVYINNYENLKYESLLFQLCTHIYTNMQHPIIFSPLLVTLTTNYCNGWR